MAIHEVTLIGRVVSHDLVVQRLMKCGLSWPWSPAGAIIQGSIAGPYIARSVVCLNSSIALTLRPCYVIHEYIYSHKIRTKRLEDMQLNQQEQALILTHRNYANLCDSNRPLLFPLSPSKTDCSQVSTTLKYVISHIEHKAL